MPRGKSMNEPLFKGAHQALTFAYNYSSGTVDRPMMLKLADKVKRTGRGLGGLDGAAQAGLIQREMLDLDRLQQQIILAKFLPKAAGCPCCGHDVPSIDWLTAVRAISDEAMARGILSGHLVHRAVRDGIVARYFGQKLLLGDLAVKAGINADTVTAQNAQIVNWLRGTRLVKKRRSEFEAGVKGEEAIAMERAEAILYEAGIVGSPEAVEEEMAVG